MKYSYVNKKILVPTYIDFFIFHLLISSVRINLKVFSAHFNGSYFYCTEQMERFDQFLAVHIYSQSRSGSHCSCVHATLFHTTLFTNINYFCNCPPYFARPLVPDNAHVSLREALSLLGEVTHHRKQSSQVEAEQSFRIRVQHRLQALVQRRVVLRLVVV